MYSFGEAFPRFPVGSFANHKIIDKNPIINVSVVQDNLYLPDNEQLHP
jgi:hypothetical protein